MTSWYPESAKLNQLLIQLWSDNVDARTLATNIDISESLATRARYLTCALVSSMPQISARAVAARALAHVLYDSDSDEFQSESVQYMATTFLEHGEELLALVPESAEPIARVLELSTFRNIQLMHADEFYSAAVPLSVMCAAGNQFANPKSRAALSLGEFWLHVVEETNKQDLALVVREIIPLLLTGMRLSPTELVSHGVSETGEWPPKVVLTAVDAMDVSIPSNSDNDGDGNDENGHGSEEGEDDYSFEPDESWTLRKCSAATLDELSGSFGKEMVDIVKQALPAMLKSNDWLDLETAILAIGAISHSCIADLTDVLDDLASGFETVLRDKSAHPILHNISAWSLARLFTALAGHEGANKSNYPALAPSRVIATYMDALQGQAIVAATPGSTRIVQKKRLEAVFSGLATIMEDCKRDDLIPIGPDLADFVFTHFNEQGGIPTSVALDCLSSFAEAWSSSTPMDLAIAERFLAPLVALYDKFETVPQNDQISIIETLSTAAPRMGSAINASAGKLFTGALGFASRNLDEESLEQRGALVVANVDLLAGLMEGLDPSVSGLLIQANADQLSTMILDIIKLNNDDLLQSIAAMLGDMPAEAYPLLGASMHTITAQLITLLSQSRMGASARTNIVWMMSRGLLRNPDGMRPLVPALVTQLQGMLSMYGYSAQNSLRINTALCFGMLGLVAPKLVAPIAYSMTQQWARALQGEKDDEAAMSAIGMLKIMLAKLPSEDERPQFVHVLLAVKNMGLVSDDGDPRSPQAKVVLNDLKKAVGPEYWAASMEYIQGGSL
ncbi:armadillo-type protein [Blastocladiella britannica]|nr:armadillo-type protein [Blastocladiella britannica]